MMATVIVRPADYSLATLRPLVGVMLTKLAPGRIGSGTRVLVKPNLLSPARPEQAILTHPLLVRAVVEYILDQGGVPLVGDSPAIGSFDRILRDGGYNEALKGVPCVCRPFTESDPLDIGPPFGRIEIARGIREADVILNLPKLKTHSQMLLTLGVKNLFGCVVGYRKPEWHMRLGLDRMQFARLLVRIYETLRPAVTILDGILALEGEGPGRRGTPRPVGVLMAAGDAHALDATVCRMLGIDPLDLATVQVAAAAGWTAETIVRDGALPRISSFSLPRLTPVMQVPSFLQRFSRRFLLRRPACDASLCRLCGECRQLCPAEAIAFSEGMLRFDEKACIRCFCCVEICPEGALYTKETWSGFLLRRAADRFLRQTAHPERREGSR